MNHQINVDFADVRTIMKDRGLAVMGTGRATGKDRAIHAALQAISSPLLENMSIEGAQAVIINISGSNNLGLHEISDAASVVYEQAYEEANIILGSVIDENLNDEVIVTIIATGFVEKEQVCAIHPEVSIESKKEASTIALDNIQNSDKQSQVEQIEVAKIDKQVDSSIQCASSSTWNESNGQKPPLNKMNQETETKIASKQSTEKAVTAIDLNDLDIPTFMRNKAEKNV